jgi:hypothetical protein
MHREWGLATTCGVTVGPYVVGFESHPRSSNRAGFGGDARIARSIVRRRPVPHPTRRARRLARPCRHRTGARKTVSVNAAEPCAITGLLGLRRCAGVSSITTIDRCSSSACFRAIGFARCWGSPTRSSVGNRVRHRWRCSGAFPDRVEVSTTGGAAQDGAHTRSVRDLAFPGSLRPRRQSWPDGQTPFVGFDQLRRSNFPGISAAPFTAVRSASGKGSSWKEEHGTR